MRKVLLTITAVNTSIASAVPIVTPYQSVEATQQLVTHFDQPSSVYHMGSFNSYEVRQQMEKILPPGIYQGQGCQVLVSGASEDPNRYRVSIDGADWNAFHITSDGQGLMGQETHTFQVAEYDQNEYLFIAKNYAGSYDEGEERNNYYGLWIKFNDSGEIVRIGTRVTLEGKREFPTWRKKGHELTCTFD